MTELGGGRLFKAAVYTAPQDRMPYESPADLSLPYSSPPSPPPSRNTYCAVSTQQMRLDICFDDTERDTRWCALCHQHVALPAPMFLVAAVRIATHTTSARGGDYMSIDFLHTVAPLLLIRPSEISTLSLQYLAYPLRSAGSCWRALRLRG
ncbi:hypothetical protein EJ06DRAFT_60150 [Trichodelitschia bisporula]|uniref:Uncharacterized protein n=1 Tax=Trichodelitschia bisporula TaxID=703511 RepID=A0A6G1HV55_9PEZI|nr:hypothetical protein EJ06DRAFT_60150 [Trichodelitschia bisporula]